MAINPYEPELAKRKKVFEIATAQLNQEMSRLRNKPKDGFRQQMEQVDIALKDYRNAGYAMAEWLEKEPTDA